MEAIVEAFVDMQKDLQAERGMAERQWVKTRKRIQRVIANTAGMYGDFQRIIGTSLQAIPALTAGDEETAEEALAVRGAPGNLADIEEGDPDGTSDSLVLT